MGEERRVVITWGRRGGCDNMGEEEEGVITWGRRRRV